MRGEKKPSNQRCSYCSGGVSSQVFKKNNNNPTHNLAIAASLCEPKPLHFSTLAANEGYWPSSAPHRCDATQNGFVSCTFCPPHPPSLIWEMLFRDPFEGMVFVFQPLCGFFSSFGECWMLSSQEQLNNSLFFPLDWLLLFSSTPTS